jgi:hypothetical protein
MPVYVMDVGNRPTLCFFADDTRHAEEFIEEDHVRADLMVYENNGASLWDGTSEITVRLAEQSERDIWQQSRKHGASLGQIDGNINDWVAYLLPITDPDDAS